MISARAHIPALDGLRGVAILLVLASHLYVPASMKLRVLADAGWVGVDLFFVLSGFLITGILLEAKGTPGYFTRFYTRRARRIFPVYYLALVVGVFLLPLTPAIARLRDLQGWYWTYLVNVAQWVHGSDAMPRNWALYWSLSVEEQFYLVWPLVVFLCSVGSLRRVCLAVIAGVWVLRPMLLINGWSGDTVYMQIFTRADALCAGAWVASLMAERRPLPWKAAAVAGSGAALGAAGLGIWRSAFLSNDPWILGAGLPLVTTSATALLLCARDGRTPAFEAPWLRFWAPYSYGLYVWHRVVTDLIPWPFVTGHVGTLALFVAKVAVSLAAAMASWHLFEQWWLRRGRSGSADTSALKAEAVSHASHG